jgi:outer membrane lipoprotein SlyB
MKKTILTLSLLTAVATLSGCASSGGYPYYGGGDWGRHRNTLAGAAIGGAGGALLGGAIGGDGRGALVGGAVGAAVGGLVGNSMDRKRERDSYYGYGNGHGRDYGQYSRYGRY